MNNNKSTNQQINKSTNQQINEYLLLKNTLSISSISINNTNTTINKILITILLLLTLTISSLLLSTKTNAATPADACFTMGGPGGTTITKYEEPNTTNNCPTDVDIPATIGGVAPTAIGNNAFDGFNWQVNNRLVSVTMPNTIVTIGNYSFRTNNITSATLSNSLISVGIHAFATNKLSNINLPTTLTTIGDRAFALNFISGNLQFPGSLTLIGAYSFNGNKITSINLPNALISIGTAAFFNNEILGHLTIPDSVNSIGGSAFQYNNITSVSLGTGLTSLSDATIFAGNDIKDVKLPNNITALANTTFGFQSSSKKARVNASKNVVDADDYKTFYYTKVYTEDPSNPNSLHDGALFLSEPNRSGGVDINNNGSGADWLNFGGHIINPAPVDINYVDQDTGSDVQSPDTFTGKGVSTYFIADDPNVYPAPADNTAYTQAELDNLTNIQVATYFHLGDSPSFDAPIIDGYVLVSPNSPYVFNLAGFTNNFKFIYKKVDSLASTGSNVTILIILTLTILLTVGITGFKYSNSLFKIR